jgi:predicted nucleic acid-binding protein
MTPSSGFAAILDANALYPAPVRDLLLHLASTGLYKPKWTDKIHEEWIRSLLENRTDLKEKSLRSAQTAMNNAFPDANITHYESLINCLILPDEDDRHVLAAAIKDKVDVIVTSNVKDFPTAVIKEFGIEIQHPDKFIVNLIQSDQSKAIAAFTNQVNNLKNPPKTKQQVLETLTNAGLGKSTALLKTLLHV